MNRDNTLSRRKFLETVTAAGALLPLHSGADSLVSSNAINIDRPICVFSKNLQWLEITEMAKEVANMGYDGIDLTVRSEGHIAPERVTQDLPEALKIIRRAGLEVPTIVTEIIDPDNPLTEPILKTASKLGIRYYRMGYLEYDRSLGVIKSLEKHEKQLKRLAALNKKYNIHGAYQNHAGTGVGAAVWDLWLLLKDIDPRWLGVQYDIKHATAEGGKSWVHDLDLLKNYIKCTDIKDFYWEKQGKSWETRQVPLGEGMVDFRKYFQLIKQYDLTGPVSLHFEYELGGAEEGMKKLTIPKEKVLWAMKRDLQTLRNMLKEASL